jgi:hypothetical protein
MTKPDQLAAEHATDFEPPIYNVWKQQSKTEGAAHFGNSDVYVGTGCYCTNASVNYGIPSPKY